MNKLPPEQARKEVELAIERKAGDEECYICDICGDYGVWGETEIDGYYFCTTCNKSDYHGEISFTEGMTLNREIELRDVLFCLGDDHWIDSDGQMWMLFLGESIPTVKYDLTKPFHRQSDKVFYFLHSVLN